jgi:hypothetical protein
MKTVPLSRGFVALVDAEDYERVIAAGPWRVFVSRPGGAAHMQNAAFASPMERQRHSYYIDSCLASRIDTSKSIT